MTQNGGKSPIRAMRVLTIGLVGVMVVLGLALVIQAIGRSAALTEAAAASAGRVDALATSRDACVDCHRDETPGIVQQYGYSTMAAAEVTCRDCHEVAADYPGAEEHEGTYILAGPTPARCQECHQVEVAEFTASRHSIPAYVAMVGAQDLDADMAAIYSAIPEGTYNPDQLRNALYALEGPEITRFACEGCHNIGLPQPDGSVGECQQCHLRHTFSLAQARQPETCNACHIGPDHPQWEIYQESAHGIAYATGGDSWNWDADPGSLSVTDFPAPTCATCHMSGFGDSPTTHDVGDRLTWYLFAPTSTRRPDWETNQTLMQGVCRECHSEDFILDFYTDADAATEAVNARVAEGSEVIAPLQEAGLLTDAPFDEPIDFVSFDLWHHWGRTAKFGVWMQGPDYTQWHGAYEMLRGLPELREMVADRLAGAE
jgi:hydroxylamine dehydrogenase